MLNHKEKKTISDICSEMKLLLPEKYKNSPWQAMHNRGKDIISNDETLACYFVAYSKRHEYCIKESISEIPTFVFENKFYIMDWGCGQGIATLALCEHIHKKFYLENIQAAILVDPSAKALEKARENIETWLPKENIFSRKCFFEELDIHSLKSDYPVIHLFSNILDINSIDLYDLAERLINLNSSPAYVVINSPNYQQARDNINYFLNLYSKLELYNKTNTYQLEYEVAYQYFSAVAKINPEYSNISTIDEPCYRKLFSLLHKSLGRYTEIYFKPFQLESNNINAYIIDFLILNKNRGAVFFKIIDKEIFNEKDLQKEIDKIETYRSNIVNELFPYLNTKQSTDKKIFSIPSRALFFSKNSKNDILNFHDSLKNKNEKYKYINLICNNELNVKFLQHFIFSICLRAYYFDENIYNEIKKSINDHFHYKEMGRKFNFSDKAEKLVTSKAGSHQKIKGFAGSGKTLLLVHRAVQAQKRTNKPVLILVFNITVCNCIKDKLNSVYEDFDLSQFVITNYHKFIRDSLTTYNVSKSLEFSDYSDMNLFESVKDKIAKYQSVFIDEAQDFEENWLKIVSKYFLENTSEFVVFADEKQNIYQRHIDGKEKMPEIPTIKGRWNKLEGSKRLSKKFIELALDFQKYFLSKYEQDSLLSVASEQVSLIEPLIKYEFFEGKDCDFIAEYIYRKYNKYHIKDETTTVLMFSHSSISELDDILKNKFKVSTNSMCISSEDIKNISNNFDRNNFNKSTRRNLKKEDIVEKLYRSKKETFYPQYNCINLSTLHSFKGFESDTLFIILGEPNQTNEILLVNDKIKEKITDELIYTSLTRCKKRLFIIGINKSNYHEYFSTSKFFRN